MCDAFDTIYSGSTSAFNTVDSVQLMLGVLAVFRPSVLVILPLLDLVQVSILRGAVVLAAFQGFLLRENAKKFQRYPPKDLCTACYERKSSKKKF